MCVAAAAVFGSSSSSSVLSPAPSSNLRYSRSPPSSSMDSDWKKEREMRREKKSGRREQEREKRINERRRRRREDDYEEEKPEQHKRKRSKEDVESSASRDKMEMRAATQQHREHHNLDEERIIKLRRKVEEWRVLRRKQEESVNTGDELTMLGGNWTLEEESDDDYDCDEASSAKPVDDKIDPLDAFMNSLAVPQIDYSNEDKNFKSNAEQEQEQREKGSNKSLRRIIPSEGFDYSDYEDFKNDDEEGTLLVDEDDDEFMRRVMKKKTRAERLLVVDHSKIEYPPFRKKFYIEVKEISKMTPQEVAAHRKQLELKIHGKDVPKPIKTWHQTGLLNKILETIKKLGYEKPMPIQAQALPLIMSGRDCIGIAKTGSGKTLAFVLPMLRHIKNQPPSMTGDGPIGLIVAPTRELVQQIYSVIKKFTKVMGLRCEAVYGGSCVAQQISELKRGAEIVICTPGRMIDILGTSAGKITNLHRVTYLVMDEADRMFDMGFEPQIIRIVQNTRPDRQTVMFSATFPRHVEMLARKILNKPVEIQVGGRSVVNKDITQFVEVIPEYERFRRLLKLLRDELKDKEMAKVLIFVSSQEKCDALYRDLCQHGLACLPLHGATDQNDRESFLADFKGDICDLLIATSVAARGLDVKELELVINYDVPNHYEDYVHRVGRTGRAGRKGRAVTFVSEEDARYASDLVKALELSEQVVPNDLKALADGFMAKVKKGLEHPAHGTGYGGSGFKFNEEEDEVRRAEKKAQAKGYGFEEYMSDSKDEDEEGVRKAGGNLSQQEPVLAHAAAQLLPFRPVSLPGVLGLRRPTATTVVPGTNNGAAARAMALAAAMNLQHKVAKIQDDAMPAHYKAELEINDFPQNARWEVMHKETRSQISEWTGAAITTRGQYFPPGSVAGEQKKLHLFIEGPTEQSVEGAKAELKRVLEGITVQAKSTLTVSAQPRRYTVA